MRTNFDRYERYLANKEYTDNKNSIMEDTNTTEKIEFKLNDDQQLGLDALNDWLYKNLNAKDETLFAKLTGSAGTGKTTLMDSFLKELHHPYRTHRVCICAPTHKAKKVIKQKTGWGNAETLQALLGLKLDTNLDDFDPNNPAFSPIGDRKIKDYSLVIIDESSMINSDLYITICDCARATSTKVLFVGDTKQLNPVKEYSISPSLLTPTFGYNLTKVVRQANTNPLLILLDTIRQDIENGTNLHISYLINNPKQYNEKGEGYETCSGEIFANHLAEGFKSEEFKTDKNYCRFISWTNNTISLTNKYIREKILACNESLQVGELLLSYKTLAADEFLVLVNSDDYLVQSIDTGSDNNYDIKTWSVRVCCVDTDKVSKISVVIPDVKNYERFKEVHFDLLNRAKSSRAGRDWKQFYGFRDAFVLMEPINGTMYGKPYLVAKKDIDYGYGITIHKSQGSTYNTVYVNGKDINRNSNDAERLKLWYVALSRASNKAIINL